MLEEEASIWSKNFVGSFLRAGNLNELTIVSLILFKGHNNLYDKYYKLSFPSFSVNTILFQITFICMLAIGIRNDETRSQLHENIIAPFTSEFNPGANKKYRESSVRPVAPEYLASHEVNNKDIDANVISADLEDNSQNNFKSQNWKFENYKIENWDRWRDIPFHLKEGEDTSKYFR